MPSGVQRAVRRAAQRPPGVARPAAGGQRPRPRFHRPAVAGGGPDPGSVAGVDRTSTSCRPARGSCRTNARCRPSWWRSWTPATPPVYVGFGSMPCAPEDVARVAIEAIRAQGRRVLVSPRLGRPGPDRRPGRLLRRRRGQPAGTVRPGGRRRAPRRRGHDDDGRPGRRASGGGAPDGGPAVLGRPGGRPGHRRGTRRSDPDRRVPVGRARARP